MPKGEPSDPSMFKASLIVTGVFLLTFQTLELFKRPHKGRFFPGFFSAPPERALLC